MRNSWSDNLLEETRTALDGGFVGIDGFLHMKNINGSFGKIILENVFSRKFLIQDKETHAEKLYNTTDELIDDGWAID